MAHVVGWQSQVDELFWRAGTEYQQLCVVADAVAYSKLFQGGLKKMKALAAIAGAGHGAKEDVALVGVEVEYLPSQVAIERFEDSGVDAVGNHCAGLLPHERTLARTTGQPLAGADEVEAFAGPGFLFVAPHACVDVCSLVGGGAGGSGVALQVAPRVVQVVVVFGTAERPHVVHGPDHGLSDATDLVDREHFCAQPVQVDDVEVASVDPTAQTAVEAVHGMQHRVGWGLLAFKCSDGERQL